MRFVFGASRRHARVRVPRARGAGRRPPGRHGRGPGRRRLAAPRPGGVRRGRCSPVRLLHAGPRRRDRRPPQAHPRPERGRDPRGALRKRLPLHRLREDLRRRPSGRGVGMSTTTARELQVGYIGELVPRADGIPKTTGEFAYASDLWAAGMLWGHTVRSPHAHARILEIDISQALAMPGVHAVLTHADVPGQKTYGLEFPDQPVLAIDRVRYFGEPVVLVAAEHPEQARRAAEKVKVEYAPLELVVDPERAPEQEPLHPDRPTMGHGYLDDPRPNVVRHMVIHHGDPETTGDLSVEGVYDVGIQDQAFLGPESGLAVP